MKLKKNVFVLIAIALMSAPMFAQVAIDSSPQVAAGAMAFPLPSAKPGMISIHADGMGEVAPVKGAPFCATVTTEHTQVFADGNRIHTTDSSTVCRDSEGRTRREASLNLLGAGAQKSAPKLITITDPVAGVHYMLDTENKIARRLPVPPGAAAVTTAGGAALPDKGEHMMFYQASGAAGPDVFFSRQIIGKPGEASDEPQPVTERLGDQTIDGIHATGTRMTTTIPAGKMGNEQPIIVTSERWYSPELKATVMTKHNDPWAGELKTEFTSVNNAEPDASLFTVPADYKIVDDKLPPLMMQLPQSVPAPPKD